MKDSRQFQLRVMAWIAFALPPLAAIWSHLHGLPPPMSISETATMAHQVSFMLPFALGAFALFSLTYRIKYSYDCKCEKTMTTLMAIGFTLVVFQETASDYITADRIGFFVVPQNISHIIHFVGAIMGFGALTLWIMLCFTKSDHPKDKQTPGKRIRNNIYWFLGWCMVGSLGILPFAWIGFFGANFPTVYVVEWVLLWFAGIACTIKSGGLKFLRDNGV